MANEGLGTEKAPASHRRKRFSEVVEESLLRGELAGLLSGQIAIQHDAATVGKARALGDHAGGDLRDVGDLRTAETECVTAAHRLRFGAESKARSRGNRRDRSGESQR